MTNLIMYLSGKVGARIILLICLLWLNSCSSDQSNDCLKKFNQHGERLETLISDLNIAIGNTEEFSYKFDSDTLKVTGIKEESIYRIRIVVNNGYRVVFTNYYKDAHRNPLLVILKLHDLGVTESRWDNELNALVFRYCYRKHQAWNEMFYLIGDKNKLLENDRFGSYQILSQSGGLALFVQIAG